MIVEPDFPDHWKTRMLVDALGDEAAPVYLLRLWAHCQNRKTSTFESLPSAALKALCRFPGHANKLESSLAASGFVRRDDQALTVVGWDDYNASLIANWENGKRGGRPPGKTAKPKKTKPPQQTEETDGFPMDNPSATHGEPIREEESREEKEPPNPQGGDGGEGPVLPKGWKKLSASDKKATRVLRNTDLMKRLGRLYRRKPETLWTVDEAAALKRVVGDGKRETLLAEIDAIEDYYTEEFPEEMKDYRRIDLVTLLNNWVGELDRARIHIAKRQP
jgi:hypothetical protein